VLQSFGNAWVRIADMSLLYVLLALGLNIVVGYAGLLDLGYVAFFAVGAYMFGLLASPHLTDVFPWIAAMFPNGLHMSLWWVLPLAAGLAGLFGVLLGAPTLKLRGDYLAIVTLGFGEIIRVFLNNLDHPVNITNGPKGLGQIDAISVFGYPLSKRLDLGFIELSSVTLYYYLFLLLVVVSVVVCHRLEYSRIGRAWMAIREDEIAAKAMGLNTRNLKLMAFGMGATFGGCVPRLCVTRIVQPDGVGDDRGDGGAGRLGTFAWRHFGRGVASGLARSLALCGRPLASHDRWAFGRGHLAPVVDRVGHDHHHAVASPWPVAHA
jgi:branched-chain amino acid transport system permease protein